MVDKTKEKKAIKFLGAKQFYGFIKKDRIRLFFEVLGFVILGLMDSLPTLFLVAIIDVLSGSNANILGFSIQNDFKVVYLFLMLVIIWLFVDICSQQLRANVRIRGKKYVFDLRKAVHKNITSPTNEIAPKFSRGDISFRLSNDIYAIDKIYTTPITEVISPLMNAVFSLAYLFFIDYKIFLIALFGLPLFTLLSKSIINKDYYLSQKIKKSQSKSNDYMVNMLNNFRMITLAKGHETETYYYNNLNNEISSNEVVLTKKYKTFWFLMNVLKITISVISLIIATVAVLNNQYSAATLLIVFNYVKNTYNPTFTITRIISSAISGSVEMERVFALMSENNFIEGDIVKDIEEIKLNNISIEIEDKQIIQNYNALFTKNKLNYLVGSSGVGKSLLLSAIYSETFLQAGEIYVNNEKIHKLNFENISACLQGAEVLNRSIKENLTYPNQEPLNEKLLKILNIEEKVLNKKDSHLLDASVQTLSGGEKRKINLYRCLSKTKPVYILDEPTNDLDKQTIKNLKKYLSEQKGKALYIIITHNSDFIEPDENIIML